MIEALIRRARRRYIGNEFLGQGTYAASAGMAGVILLLIAGTQILDWPFLVAITAGTLAFGAFRILRRIPSSYEVAQLVDRRLSLADTLSTALFFSEPGAREASPTMRDRQREQAEHAAETADLERALPFAIPRAVYLLAALGLVASGLLALRYGFTRTLDLRAPLTRIILDNFGATQQEDAALHNPPHKAKPDEPKPIGLTLPEGDPNNPQPIDPAPDSALDTIGIPDAVNDPLQKNQSQSTVKTESSGSEKGEGELGDSEGADASSADSQAEGAQSAKNGEQANAPNTGKPEASNPDANSSLMSKLRDAMSNLLSKMHQQSGSGSQRQANQGQNTQRPGTQHAGQRQNGAPGEGRQNSGEESADAESQQAGAEGKDGKNSQAQAGGHTADQKGANQPGSGIGRQDGNKDTKLAEQVAAMGKISEIIGKRSASVTGEISVEVPSSQQKLQTPYTQSNATHTDAGGEISRDEVPEILQQYVQQYFEQVRKQPMRKPETAARSKAQTPAAKTAPPSM